MSLFKALCGRHYYISIGWFESTEPSSYSIDLLQDALSRVQVIYDKDNSESTLEPCQLQIWIFEF